MERKNFALIAVGLLVLIACIAVPVAATVENFNITYDGGTVTYSRDSAHSGSLVLSQTSLMINYSVLVAPTDYIYYVPSSAGHLLPNTLNYPASGSFTVTDTGITVASGEYYISNGSYMAGTYVAQFWYHFDYFNYGTYSGLRAGTISYSPALPSELLSYNIGTGVSDNGWYNMPMYLGSPPYHAGGYHILNDDPKVSIPVQTYDTDGQNPISISVVKNVTPSLVKIYDTGGNRLFWSQTSGVEDLTPVTNLSIFPVRPIVISVTFLNSITVNSTLKYSQNGAYNISVTPNPATVNSATTLSLFSINGTTTNLNTVVFSQAYNNAQWYSSSVPMSQYGGYSSFKKNSAGNWLVWNRSKYNTSIGAGLPTTFTFAETLNGNYSIKFEATDDSGAYYEATTNFSVTGPTTKTVSVPVYIVDATNGASISSTLSVQNPYASTTWYNTSSTSGSWVVTGYGTGGSTQFQIGDYMALVGSATGYTSSGVSVYLSDDTNGIAKFVALTPTNSTPITGQFTDVVSCYDSTTYAALPGVSVTLNGVTKTTGTSGTVTFTNLTAGSYTLTATKSGYKSSSATVTGTSGQTVTTPIAMVSSSASTYYITVSPNPATVNSVATLYLSSLSSTSPLSQLRTVIFTQSYGGGTSDSVPMVNYNYSSFQKDSSGTWYARTSSGYTQSIGTTLPPAYSIIENLNGNYVLKLDATDDAGNYYTWSVALTVQGTSATISIPVYVVDVDTGANIGGSTLAVNKMGLTAWYNSTSVTGTWTITGYGPNGGTPFTIGDYMQLIPSASGYTSYAGINVYLSDSTNGVAQYIGLSKADNNPVAGEFTAVANTYLASTGEAISGVSITINGTTKTTSSTGYATFTDLTAGKSYTMTASKTGYGKMTFYVTGSSGETVPVPIGMATAVVTTSPTTRTTVTTGPTTVVPTTASGGNYTGFWGPYYNMFHAMGAQDTELGVIMTACLIIILIIIIAFVTGGNLYAVNSAAALGFILSCAFGWIYFWLILAGVLWLLIPLVFRRIE